MTPSEIGERTEAAVLAALATTGRQILVPFGGHHRFDLAYEEGRDLIKVQCKSGYETARGAIAFKTSSYTDRVHRDYRGQVDLFGVYCHARGEVYLVPVAEVPRRGAHLRVIPARNAQKAKIRMADQYLVRDGRLPEAVIQATTSAGTRDRRPTRIASLGRQGRQMSIFESVGTS